MGARWAHGCGVGTTGTDVTFEELLELVGRTLGEAGIPYMVTGSFASSMLGMPRTTRDLDVVVDPSEQQLDGLIAAFDPSIWYIDPLVVREAFSRRSMFNLVHLDSGWKVDVVIRKDRPWSREEFARRAPILVRGVPVMFLRAEDSILSKLEWVRQGGSMRQLEDAGGVLDVQGDAIDFGYLEYWAGELGVSDLLEQIRKG